MWFIQITALGLLAVGVWSADFPLLYKKPLNVEGNPIDLCELSSRGQTPRPWYVTYRYIPCQWYERANVNNIKVMLHYPDNYTDCKQLIAPVVGCRTFRGSEGCDTLYERWQFIGPRTYAFHNNLGGLNQGESVVTDPLDNDNFALIWTCFRKAPENPEEGEPDCMDVGLEIMTRERIPSPAVIAMIEASLDANFGMSLSDLKQVSQADECEEEDFNAQKVCKCDNAEERKRKYYRYHW